MGSRHLLFGLDTQQYWTSVWQILVFRDVFTGLIKPVLFGFIIATVGCYYGISTRGGNAGRGPFDHPGRGRFFSADSDRGFLCYQVDLRDLWLQVIHAGSHSAQRKSGCFGGKSLWLRPSSSTTFRSHSMKRLCSTAFHSSCRTAKPRRCLASRDLARALCSSSPSDSCGPIAVASSCWERKSRACQNRDLFELRRRVGIVFQGERASSTH